MTRLSFILLQNGEDVENYFKDNLFNKSKEEEEKKTNK